MPTGVPHKATVDVELGGHLIKKDTTVIFFVTTAMHDKDTWKDPEVFRPERFLDEKERFMSRPHPEYIPFSAGRRSYPGEKIALANLFFIVSGLIQRTKDTSFYST